MDLKQLQQEMEKEIERLKEEVKERHFKDRNYIFGDGIKRTGSCGCDICNS